MDLAPVCALTHIVSRAVANPVFPPVGRVCVFAGTPGFFFVPTRAAAPKTQAAVTRLAPAGLSYSF
jgi:hypothetical protein